jgi:hypothetical protein
MEYVVRSNKTSRPQQAIHDDDLPVAAETHDGMSWYYSFNIFRLMAHPMFIWKAN